MKIYKKLAMFLLAAILTAGTFGIFTLNTNAAGSGTEFDGDVITNPFGEIFTEKDDSGDLPVDDKETTKNRRPERQLPKETVISVGRTKVKSASKTKRSDKVKVSLKKIKGAKKYQVQISKTKKFKKVLVKKTVKKAKFTLKSKKIKNKSKLYVRARAIKVVNKKTYIGKWSKVKKIKIKK